MLSACTYTNTTVSTLQVLCAAQVLAHYLMIDQFSATADCCQQTPLEGSEPSPMIVHSSEQWDATSRIDCGRPVLLSTPKPPVFLESSIFSFFSTSCVLKWGIMATMGLWQYISITLRISMRSHKLLPYKRTLFYKCNFLTIQTYKCMRLTRVYAISAMHQSSTAAICA